ncbi:hypothetical protein ACPF8X_11380 [Streptomyces sp. G35A]
MQAWCAVPEPQPAVPEPRYGIPGPRHGIPEARHSTRGLARRPREA